MHKVAEEVETASGLPVLHIADATGDALVADKRKRVGLLGTRFTMEEDFYTNRLRSRFGLDVEIPEKAARDAIHRVIYEELCLGEVTADARRLFRAVIEDLRGGGCDSVILGCTEITMAVDETNSTLPCYDTTALHAVAAVDRALQ